MLSVPRSSFFAGLILLAFTLFAASSQAQSQQLPTALTFEIPSETAAFGTPITLTVHVNAASGGAYIHPGQIIFCDNGSAPCTLNKNIGIAPIVQTSLKDQNGLTEWLAKLTLVPSVGIHSFKVTFPGTSTAAPSGYADTIPGFPFTVTPASPSSLALNGSGSVGSYTLNAALTGQGPFPSSESISFKDLTSSATLGTANLSQATSTFSLKSTNLTTGPESSYAVTGDFNNDGTPDLVVETSQDVTCDTQGGGVGQPLPYITLSLGNGDGTFTAKPVQFSGQSFCSTLAVGDFNNDGNLDIINGRNQLLLGRGDGTFTASTIAGASFEDAQLIVGDFNNDGNADIVTNTGVVLLGKGDGTFTSGIGISFAIDSTLVLGDFNNDGRSDLVALSPVAAGTTLTLFLGRGDGTFPAQPTISLPSTFISTGANNTNAAVGDFNGDGNLDIVAVGAISEGGAGGYQDGFALALGNGLGGFSTPTTVAVPTSNIYASDGTSVVAADFDGDGKTDVATLFDESNVIVQLSNGDGTFRLGASLPSQDTYSPDEDTLLLGDFNHDGIPDLVAINSDEGLPISGQASVYSIVALTRRSQTVTASLSNVAITGTGSHDIQAAYAGDGNNAASSSNTLALGAQAVATGLTLFANPTSSTFGQQVVLTATLSPYTSQGISTNGETIMFSMGGNPVGSAQLNGGVAALNITSLPVGSDGIVAGFAGDSNFAPANSLATTVNVAQVNTAPATTLSPASLNFSAQTVGTTATAQVVTLKNTGTGALTITSISATGDFAQTNTCGNSLSGGASCMVAVTFSPTDGGSRTGTLILVDTAADSPQTVTLTGTGATASVIPAASSLTISAPGGSASTALQLGGFTGTVSLTCVVMYQGQGTVSNPPTCSFNPAQVVVSGSTPATSTLSVSTSPSTASLSGKPLFNGVGLSFAALLCAFLLPRRRMPSHLLCIMLTGIVMLGFAGCTGSSPTSGTGTTTTTSTPGTTVGAYQVNVTARNGPISMTSNIALNVQ
jgi:hypothetical protein